MGENNHPGRSMMITIESDQEETYYMLTWQNIVPRLLYFSRVLHLLVQYNHWMLSWHFGSENWSFPSQVSSGYRHFCRRSDFFYIHMLCGQAMMMKMFFSCQCM